MKKLPFIFLLFILGTFASSGTFPRKALLLMCQGNEEFVRDNPRAEQVICLREEMSSLIKEGNIPIVLERDRDVAWLYLNDPYTPRDFPESNFESDYFDIIMDLFPLKINKDLKRKLKKSNKAFIDALGIEYLVENGEIISRIDYDKFERYAF